MINKDLPSKDTFTSLAEETGALFQPNKQQRAIKARFWTIVSNSITAKNPRSMTTMEIAQTVRDNRVLNWWSVAGFKDWFLNNTEHIERLEYLFDLALTAAEEIFLSDDPKTANAKVNMAKVVAELAKKMPSRGGDKFHDEKIAKMNKEELEAFLAANGVNVQEKDIVQVEAKREEE